MSDELKACPKCGKLPKFKSVFYHARDVGTRYSLIECWYECRRWFGLRLCMKGSSSTLEKGENHDFWARYMWNRDVDYTEQLGLLPGLKGSSPRKDL